MAGENAVVIHDLDRNALLALAWEIGPTFDEITTPLRAIPAPDPERQGIGKYAFRTVGAYA